MITADKLSTIAQFLRERQIAPGHHDALAMLDVDAAELIDRVFRAKGMNVLSKSRAESVVNTGDGVELAYVREGKLHRVAAAQAVLACFHMIIPYIMPELPQGQREALASRA